MINLTPKPVLLSIGSINIYTWGFFFAIALLVGAFIAAKEAKRKNLDAELIYESLIYIIIGAVIGSRLLHVILYWSSYAANPVEVFYLWQGGMASYGGFIGAFIALLVFAKIKKLRTKTLLQYFDCYAPAVAMGAAITRVGTFIAWFDYGFATNLPWAVQVAGDVPRHPTQLYYVLADLAMFFALMYLRDKKELFGRGLFNGSKLLLFAIMYSFLRFFIDFTRYYDAAQYASQIGLAITFGIAMFLYWRYSKPARSSEKEAETR